MQTNKGQSLLTWDRRKVVAGLNMFLRSQPSPIPLANIEKTNAQQYAQ